MTCSITVVVVTYNSEDHVGALLDSLPDAFGDRAYTTVVVDNGSQDGTVALLLGRDDCTVVRSTNDGFAAGVNTGVRHQGGTGPILVLNPDVVLEPGAVPAMVGALEAPGTGIVAPLVLEADGRLSPSLRREPTLARATGLSFTRLARFSERVDDVREYTRPHVVDWAMGAILLLDRACYEAVGGFDESYFLYSEETDFCLTARDLGWYTVFEPSARAMHVGGGSGESDATHAMQVVNRVRLYRRRNGDLKAWLYFALVLAREVRRAVVGRPSALAGARALLRPALRPPELACGPGLLPR
ncbi:glycosyltransferase family 2 protein [Georgenia muralis]|uniref:GT2 family glycosyltransferase n=1 Tax=Georgenia muralis TaxID=154117 RepID=A0A3N5A2J6_9MICO|nr:glycosyltransferase family 2 protein [Georgenia muralis]RPF26081.1 GT2 family glycosyltransferase [Georgenia muralis]